MPDLCPQCREEWLAWLDYRIPRITIQIGNNAMSDTVAAAILARKERRHDDWARTIRTQQKLIADICAAHHHAAEENAA